MIRDFINNLKVDQVIDPVVHTADVDGASVDLLGYEGCVFIGLIGESGDTLSGSVYAELEIEESVDDSTFTDVDDGDIVGEVAGTNDGCFAFVDAAAEDDAVFTVQYNGSSRYVRPVINVTGTHSNGIPIGIIAIRFGKRSLPIA